MKISLFFFWNNEKPIIIQHFNTVQNISYIYILLLTTKTVSPDNIFSNILALKYTEKNSCEKVWKRVFRFYNAFYLKHSKLCYVYYTLYIISSDVLHTLLQKVEVSKHSKSLWESLQMEIFLPYNNNVVFLIARCVMSFQRKSFDVTFMCLLVCLDIYD